MRGASRIVVVCAVLVAALIAASVAAAAPLSVRIEGNHFVNGDGQTIRLLGVNHPSFEYACVDGFGYDEGHMDAADAAAVASWNANAVRVPLNEDCWLGINGQPNNNEAPGETFTAPGYRAAVESYVADLNAEGIYAILDLHWSAPEGKVANGQQPMPDSHSTAFWSSVAATFKGDPAVVFDLFNEPFSPADPRSGDDPAHPVSWSCWANGGCMVPYYESTGTRTGTLYEAVGMQTLLNAVRATGATQPVLIGGLDYANDLTGWVANAPHDPLGQVAASFHNYQFKDCNDVACWNSEVAPVAADVPVVTGEFDQQVCAASNFDDEYMEWADQHGVGYLAWGWWVLSPSEITADGCNAYYLLTDHAGTPASPNGTNLRSHLLTLPAHGVTGGTTGGGPSGEGSSGGGSSGSAAGSGSNGNASGGGGATKPPIKVLRFAAKPGSDGTTVSFTVKAAESCKGAIAGQSVKPVARAGHKPKPIALGSAHFSLTANKPKTVVLKLSAAERQALEASGSLRGSFTLTVSGATNATTTKQLRTTLKPA